MKNLFTPIICLSLLLFSIVFLSSCSEDIVSPDNFIESNYKKEGTRLPKGGARLATTEEISVALATIEEADAAATLHLFIKVNDSPYENGTTLYTRKNVEYKIQPWYWTYNAQGQRVEWPDPKLAIYWIVPAEYTWTKTYYQYYSNGGYETTSARGYTFFPAAGATPGYTGKLSIGDGHVPVAYIELYGLPYY